MSPMRTTRPTARSSWKVPRTTGLVGNHLEVVGWGAWSPFAPVTGATATRWLLDPVAGTAVEEALDDLVHRFPTINEAMIGRPSAISYSVAFPGAGWKSRDRQTRHRFRPTASASARRRSTCRRSCLSYPAATRLSRMTLFAHHRQRSQADASELARTRRTRPHRSRRPYSVPAGSQWNPWLMDPSEEAQF